MTDSVPVFKIFKTISLIEFWSGTLFVILTKLHQAPIRA